MPETIAEKSRDMRSAFFSRRDLMFLGAMAVFIFLQTFILPFVPVYVEGDQLLPVSNAMRILDGEVMYREFFHFAPPGADLYYAAAFSLFGIKVWVMNATVVFLALAQLMLVFAFSKKLLSGNFVYLPTLIFFVLGFRLYGIDGSYRLFSVVFVLLAAWIVLKGLSSKAIIAAGVLCGLSSFFVQTRGVLGIGAIGLFILWAHCKDEWDFKSVFRDWTIASVSFLITLLLTQLPMAIAGGIDNYYFANFVFLKNHYGADTLSNTAAYFSDLPDFGSYVGNYGTFGGIFRYARVAAPTLFFYTIVPLTYLFYFAYRRFRTVDEAIDRGLMLLSILGVVLYIGVSAPTGFRIYHIAIPAVVVLVFLLSRVITNQIALAGVLLLGLLGAVYSVQRQTVEKAIVDLPAGRAAFLSPPMAEKYLWLKERTKPGDLIYEAQHPTYYFPMLLKNPSPFYLIRDNNYTPDFQVAQLIQSLESRPPRYIVWHGLWSKEAADRKPGDNLDPLWQLIQRKYELRHEFRELGEFTTNSERDIEFWELRP